MTVDQKCGCGGEIEKGIGCITYNGSSVHMQDAQHEDFRRSEGLGFDTASDSFDAMMSMHLQANGLTFDQTVEVMHKK